MKITDFAIVFVIVVAPIFIISGFHVKDQTNVQFVEMKYVSALRTAVQDAGSVLNANEKQEWEAGYGSSKFFRADKELALTTFFQTMYLNLGIEDDPAAQQALQTYIPAVAVIDYDGYYICTENEYVEPSGENVIRMLWSPKKPYAYSDEAGNIVRFTLDNYTTAYDTGKGIWLNGLQRELKDESSIPLLGDSDTFEQVRRSTIVRTIQADLEYAINRHNEWAARNGVSYIFTLPAIPEEEWNNTIDDIGMMAFIQGIPIGDTYLNNYALGGGRLIKSPVVHAGKDPLTGIKYFYRSGCSFPLEEEETFASPKEAAVKGYFEKSCTGPGR